MQTLHSLAATISIIGKEIGPPSLCNALAMLTELTSKHAPEAFSYEHSPPTVRSLGLMFAYVWDAKSTRMRDLMERLSVMVQRVNDDELLLAYSRVEASFLRMSERVYDVEVVLGYTYASKEPHVN